jgi:hypothetical protein
VFAADRITSFTSAATLLNKMGSVECPICGRPVRGQRGVVQQLRLGLDEAPELVVCECKMPADVLAMVRVREYDIKRMLFSSSASVNGQFTLQLLV